MKPNTNKVSKASWSLDLVLLLCLLVAPASLSAAELTEQQVGAAVQTWVRYVTADADPNAVIEIMEPHQVEGKTVAYIAHLRGGGFCLCGQDDLVLPVYLYNPQGAYDPDNPNYQYVLWEIATRTKNLTKASTEKAPELQKYQGALSARASFWQQLMAGTAPIRLEGMESSPEEPVKMELNLTSQWNQNSPYNDLCPELNPGNDTHVPAGCVATAMAQIMYYWQWPNTGKGNESVDYTRRWTDNWMEEPLTTDPNIPVNFTGRLEWTSIGGGRLRMNGYWDGSIFEKAYEISNDYFYRTALNNLYYNLPHLQTTEHSADFGATTYNWSILQDIHTDPPDVGDYEAAKLCYHAGIAVHMTYGAWGSGASLQSVVFAMPANFWYDPNCIYGNRNIATMTEEIQWLRPVELRGRKPTGGGHAWVVYGYDMGTDPARQFLMNIGHEPARSHVWYSCDDPNLGWIDDQAHVTRLAPLNVVQFVGNTISGDGSPSKPYKNVEQAIDPITGAPDGATLIFKAGSVNTFSAAPLVINRPFTLKGYNVVIE